jgi:glycosyltransferase involved in cell wall biosynthesis
VGRDWKRKGGDLVIAAAAHLVAQGIRVELDLVGCDVPRRYQALPWVKTHGLLRLNAAGERRRLGALFAGAHFAFIPSRAEAYGMTFAEANAFGVPVISTSTGGITSIVRSGVNGYLLPMNAEGPAYAEVIAAAFRHPGEYARLARASFQEFESRLNWRVFCTRYLEAAARMCGLPPPGRETAAASDHENRLCR